MTTALSPRIQFIADTLDADGDVSGFNQAGDVAHIVITLDGVPLQIVDEDGDEVRLYPELFGNVRALDQLLKATAAYNARGDQSAQLNGIYSAYTFQDNTNAIDFDALIYGDDEDDDAIEWED